VPARDPAVMSRRRRASNRLTRALMGLLVLAVLIPVGMRESEATFVAASANPGSQFSSAADFNTVAVVLTNPGTPLRGSVPLAATAASDRSIASVVFSTAPAGMGTWTVACTRNAAPYTCAFDTTAVADGLRDVRAVATDSAGYTRTSTLTNRRVDNTAPTAATTDPGSPLTGTVTVAGTAADAGSGLATVAHEYRSTTGSWTQFCTQATSPISCGWNTTSLADGLYDLRTVATDAAGNQTISSPVSNRRVDNTAPAVTISDPGAALKGTITLDSASGDGNGSGVASVQYEYKLSTGSTWVTACPSAAPSATCTFNTATAATPDNLYDFRAMATDGVNKSTTSTPVTSRRIDNTAPTGVTLGAVGTPLQNTVNLTGGATDSGSAIASVRFQYAVAGSGTWSDACTDPSTPYTCAFSTATVADGLYDMRALATDNAGNTTASAVQVNRRIDNSGPVVVLTSPGAGRVRGMLPVGGTATDGVGVASVAFEYRPAGGTWGVICVDTTQTYSCLGDSTLVVDGAYELRMTATDTLGHASISAPVAVTVDNTAPTAANVQAANVGTAGTINANDTLTFSWSEPMAPASILAGWAGGTQNIRVRVNNVGTTDTLDLYNAAGTTKLNVVAATQALRLQADWVTAQVDFNATMTMTGNGVVVTIGSLISGTPRTGVTTGANMIWNPSTLAADAVGNPAAATVLTETGVVDRDF
jgi:chitinase